MTSAGHRHIAVAGNVGAGKSSLVRALAEERGWEPLFEAQDANPYLTDFYRDMRAWGFHSQVVFLTRRLEQYQLLAARRRTVVQDRTVYEDAEVFCRNLHEQGALEDRDYACYRDLYEAVRALLPPPDLIVYLRCTPETLLRRIAARGRPYERNVSPDYIARLSRLYDAWAAAYAEGPLVAIDVDDLDWEARPADLQRVLAAIDAHLPPAR